MTRIAYRSMRAAVFAVALGGCAPVETDAPDSMEPIGTYETALVRRDSVRAQRALLLMRRDSLRAVADTPSPPDSLSRLERLRELLELAREFEELRDGDDYRGSRYRLFTECAPVKLSQFGETSEFPRTVGGREMAESRLRAARIWGGREDDDGEADPLVLHIDYGATRATFRKEVWDPLSGEFDISEV